MNLSVEPADQDAHDELDARMGDFMMQTGGPPAGLMSHLVYPDGAGFVVADVWRTEAEGRAFFDEVFRPMLVDSGLSFTGPTTHPVWGFARP